MEANDGGNEAEQYFDEFLSYVNSDIRTWQESDDCENLKIWRRDWDPSTTLCMRNEAYFPDVSPEVAFTVVADQRVRKKWDHRLESYEVIEQTDEMIV